MDNVKKILQKHGQDHLIKFYSELVDNQKQELEQDIQTIVWEKVDKIKQCFMGEDLKLHAKQQSKIDDHLLSPLESECIGSSITFDSQKLIDLNKLGLETVKQCKVAAIVLAGGQGTRLGVNHPKGLLDVGLPSHKSLFQLQAERISDLEIKSGMNPSNHINWYIMTSPATHEQTVNFFKENNYFSLREENVIFFKQNTLPAFDLDGKIFLETKSKVSKSPDGNGGLFESLKSNGIIDDLTQKGIEYLHVYCVDNILVKVCDPTFLGFFISNAADASSKFVEKILPNESVGTICKLDGKFKVVEYSEISSAIAEKRDSNTGKLVFNAGNICEQLFSVRFLKEMQDKSELPYHIAIKKIPYVDLHTGQIVKPADENGVKFEKFIFDFLDYTNKFVVWEVDRNEEFSPIKNPDSAEKDNPRTARESLLKLASTGRIKL